MVSLSLMARLVEAVRAGARLILVGDPGQLTSIEAGVVLGDIVGPAGEALRMSAPARAALSTVVGAPVDAAEPPAGAAIADGIVVLEQVRRHQGGIADLAAAIRGGDPDEVFDVLGAEHPGVEWVPIDATAPSAAPDFARVRADVIDASRSVIAAARDGNEAAALAGLRSFRMLCAHRRGDHGVSTWTSRIETWLGDAIPDFNPDGPWYAGRPLIVTANDYDLRLFNGDAGVVIRDRATGELTAAFDRRPGNPVRPSRLEAVDTAFAMTVHKSQGSEFDTAVVLLPPPTSPILTRELLYTAATRARERLVVVGTEMSVRRAVLNPAARASGLRRRLWGD
jgi:exodeoxyribonuclease V alpha subunit